MRTQQHVWQKEHATAASLPSEMKKISSQEPSSYVREFMNFLGKQKFPLSGKAIDIGAGKGRNTLYLAQLGFNVYAVDYIDLAIQHIASEVGRLNLTKKVVTLEMAIDSKWKFKDNFFDIAVDCFSSIDIETKEGRDIYKNEMYRTLKPGGYALVVVVSAEDEIESELIKKYPGLEKNSSIWPGTSKFQKNYNEEELRDFYKEFKIVELKKVQKEAHKLGRNFLATNYWMVLQKS